MRWFFFSLGWNYISFICVLKCSLNTTKYSSKKALWKELTSRTTDWVRKSENYTGLKPGYNHLTSSGGIWKCVVAFTQRSQWPGALLAFSVRRVEMLHILQCAQQANRVKSCASFRPATAWLNCAWNTLELGLRVLLHQVSPHNRSWNHCLGLRKHTAGATSNVITVCNLC